MSAIKESRIYQSLVLPLWLLGIIWGIHAMQWLLGIRLGYLLGISPRETSGLIGVITSPLIHSDWGHLIANTPPLFAMSVIILFFYRSIAIPSFVLVYLLTGLSVWALAKDGYHIGASGVVYGLVSFVAWTGIFRRNLKSIVLALLVLFYYGSLFLGILPGQVEDNISWESHLMGGIVGIFVAFLYKDKKEKDEVKQKPSWELEAPEEERSFLDPSTFEKTKIARERDRERGGNSDPWYQSNTWR